MLTDVLACLPTSPPRMGRSDAIGVNICERPRLTSIIAPTPGSQLRWVGKEARLTGNVVVSTAEHHRSRRGACRGRVIWPVSVSSTKPKLGKQQAGAKPAGSKGSAAIGRTVGESHPLLRELVQVRLHRQPPQQSPSRSSTLPTALTVLISLPKHPTSLNPKSARSAKPTSLLPYHLRGSQGSWGVWLAS